MKLADFIKVYALALINHATILKMKKQIIAAVFALVLCALLTSARPVSAQLNQGDIMSLSKPAIVKIYHQIGGTLSIPTIKLDIKTMSLSLDDSYKASAKTTYVVSSGSVISYKSNYTIDPQTVYGTGFIVNPDGYIITNAHVASDKYLEQDYLTKLEQNLVDEMIGAYDKKYPGKLDQIYPTNDEWTNIYNQLDADMLKLVTDNAQFDSQLVVIPQTSSDTTLEDLFRDGYAAKVVSVMDDLFSAKNQDKDLAVIKIEQTNLTALKIDSTNSAQIGQKIFVWGYPYSAEFNSSDITNPTLTEGIVNAFKDSSDKSFKLIQTDAKISEGSSGSPILNEKGEVVGIITYTSGDTGAAGDSFGWGIPSSLILQVMKNGSIANNTSYYDNFSAAVNLLRAKKCKSAVAKFDIVKNTNEKFPTSQYVQPYIDNCMSLINSGRSIDSVWAEMWVAIGGFLARMWLLIIVIIAGIVGLVFEIMSLKKQNATEEADITNIRKSLGQDEAEITKIETVVDSHGKEIENLKGRPESITPAANDKQ